MSNERLTELADMFMKQLKNHPKKVRVLIHPSDSNYTEVLPLNAVVEVLLSIATELVKEPAHKCECGTGHTECDECEDEECNKDCDKEKEIDNSEKFIDKFEFFSDDMIIDEEEII
jgi:hypothetical protein